MEIVFRQYVIYATVKPFVTISLFVFFLKLLFFFSRNGSVNCLFSGNQGWGQDLTICLEGRATRPTPLTGIIYVVYNRSNLLGQDGKVEPKENNRTSGLDNTGIVGLQRQIMRGMHPFMLSFLGFPFYRINVIFRIYSIGLKHHFLYATGTLCHLT